MPSAGVITDAQIVSVLGTYAAMVGRVLDNPQRWLGADDEPPPSAALPARALDAVRDRAFGAMTPASPTWDQEPLDRRIDWWVNRIGITAGSAAAAPRFFGALANRVPLADALGAAAAGLSVCATAREHGVTDPDEWVPLLGTVLFDRDLSAEVTDSPAPEESEQRLDDSADDPGADEEAGGLTGGAKRAAKTLWALARALLGLGDLLGRRPRGGRLVRLLTQVPVVGVAGGWLDERGGIRTAARETAELVGQR